MKIIKRSGAEEDFNPKKIEIAVKKANESVVPSARMSDIQIKRIAEDVESAALNDLYIETRYPTDLPFSIDELEIRRYLDMAERMFSAIRRELYAGGRPHRIE